MSREIGRGVIDVGTGAGDDDAIPGRSEDITGLVDDLDSQLDSITAEFGADGNDVRFMLKVYQVVPKTGKLQYLFTVTPSELPIMDRLRDEYGGGDYEIRVYKNNKLNRKLTESIGAPPQRPMIAPKDNTDAVVQGFNKLAELLAQRQPQQQQQPANLLEMMTGFAALITALKPVISPSPVPTEPQRDPIELLMKGMEMAKMARESVGENETGATMMDILRDVIKGAAPAIGQLMLTQTPAHSMPSPSMPTMALPATSAASTMLATPSASKNTQPDQPPMMQSIQNIALKKYVSMLVKKASEDANPELYAEFILDNVPYETIKSYLARPDLAAEMAKLDGNVNKYRPWFAELEAVIRELVSDAEAEAEKNGSGTDNLTPPADPLETGGHATDNAAFNTEQDT